MFTPLDVQNTSNCMPTPWHPSVIYVKEGWSGHMYWMAQTPFPPEDIPPYRDRYELPCIHFSDDGIHWNPISTNPLVDLESEEIEEHNYYSDPHLVVKEGHLEIFFRYTILKNKQLLGNKTLLLRSVSEDGSHWSRAEVIADLRRKEDLCVWGEQIISQAICWNGTQYYCWYVDRSSYLKNRCVRMSTSYDGIVWTPNVLCELVGNNVDPWHIDVQYYDGKYQMIVYDMYKLLWYESVNGESFKFVSEILRPSSHRYDFYSDGLYRACSVKSQNEIRVYFSAKRKNKTYIGLLSTIDRKQFRPVCGISILHWLPIVWKSLLKEYIKSFKILCPANLYFQF